MESIYEQLPLYPGDSTAPIRLLRVNPAQGLHDGLECELFVSSLDNAAQTFEALSYTWGSSTELVSIKLQGKPHHVTQNLAVGLRHLRLPDRSRILWVDALCINQSDDVEKSKQVAQMRRVYTSPGIERVVVWLGEEASAQVAMDFMDEFRAMSEVVSGALLEVKQLLPTLSPSDRQALTRRLLVNRAQAIEDGKSADEFLASLHSPAEKAYLRIIDSGRLDLPLAASLEGRHAEWAACEELFSRPWWSRTWIVQEVAHTREVVVQIGTLAPVPIDRLCGMAESYANSASARRSQLQLAPDAAGIRAAPPGRNNFDLWLRIGGTTENTASTILKLRERYAAEGEAAAPRLPALLLQLRAQAATDPRDKIYGLLGMSSNEYGIEVDYRIGKAELYTRVARFLLRRVLVMLSWIEGPERQVSLGRELPSWVPDFSMQQTSCIMAMNSAVMTFSANKGFPAVDGEQEPHLLQPGDERILVLRCIRVGVIREIRDIRVTSDPELEEGGEDAVRLFGYESAGRLQTIDKSDGTRGSFTNSNWGPYHAKVGDVIVVAATGTLPLVLRPVDGDTYLFVGGCWLVDSDIQDILELDHDPGFSPIMFGSWCGGKTLADVDMFRIL
jgi:hypothetical protein